MAEFPALPLWTDAYLADTRHLTAAQHGAYLLLLMTAWRTPDCKLPNDDDFLCRWSGMGKRQWEANRDVILAFWRQDENNKLYQPRLVDEQNFVRLRRNKNLQSVRARWLKNKNSGLTNVYTKPIPNSYQTDTPTPTPSKSVSNSTNTFTSTEFVSTNPVERKNTKKESSAYTEAFLEFWEIYPKNAGSKKVAFASWVKALVAANEQIIIDGAKRYAAYLRATGTFVAHAATWLNQARWESNYEVVQYLPPLKLSPADERERRMAEKAVLVQARLDAERSERNGMEGALTIEKEERNYDED